MKKLILFYLFIFLMAYGYSQTNTFPSTGSTGIGTTTPSTILEVNKAFASGSTQADFLRLTATQPGAWFSQLGLQFRWNDPGNGVAWNLAQVTANAQWPSGSSYGGDLQFWTKNIHTSQTSELTEKMRILHNGNVGIGTTTPTNITEINKTFAAGSTQNDYLRLTATQGGAWFSNTGLQFRWNDAGNSAAWNTASVTGIVDGWSHPNGSGALVFNTKTLGGYTNEPDEKMRITGAGNVGIGTSAPAEKLSVNGNISARKVIVTQSGWSDYVFNNDYKLRTLSSLETFIKQNKHLPEVPSAKEVEEKGISVGDNQALLLKKIEEMTLYIIALNKKVASLELKVNKNEN